MQGRYLKLFRSAKKRKSWDAIELVNGMGVAEVNVPEIKNEFIAHSKINFVSDKGANRADFSFLKSGEETKRSSRRS